MDEEMDAGFSSEPTQLFLCVQLLFSVHYFRNKQLSLFFKMNLNLPPVELEEIVD